MTAPSKRVDGQAVARLTELADYVVPFTLRAIADLRIADLLADGPRAITDLAAASGTHAPTLERALRALAGRGVFTEVCPGVFGLTDLAEPLRSDHPLSLREAYPLLPAEVAAWGRLDHTLRTGEASFDVVHGIGFWEHMHRNPDEGDRFDASQQAVTRRELRSAVTAYDWSGVSAVVDVGGGNGAFLAGLLTHFPQMRGVLLDQPHVVASAPAVLAAQGVGGRCEVHAGSFFDEVPAGGDAYLLKRVLYGWDDAHALELLRNVRRAMGPGSRLLLLEPIVEPGDGFSWGKLYDLLLVAMSGGGARTREQLHDLLGRAGFTVTGETPTRALPILEARPA